jgi:hypothetical protein
MDVSASISKQSIDRTDRTTYITFRGTLAGDCFTNRNKQFPVVIVLMVDDELLEALNGNT